MKNLEKVWSIWKNLDQASMDSGLTMVDFLKKIVSEGNRESVVALLAKIANDVLTPEDNKKYYMIQTSMLAVLNSYEMIPKAISSLNEFISLLIQGDLKQDFSFEEISRMVSVYLPFEAQKTEFRSSCVGVEYITAETIHKVKLVSDSAVMVPIWLKNVSQLKLSNSSFHKKVSRRLNKMDTEKKESFIFADKELCRNLEILKGSKKTPVLNCGEISVEVKLI